MNKKLFSTKNILIYILILAFLLRIVSLVRPDMQGDEVTYSFRAIGYLDYLGSEQQTTPIQWFSYLPWWSKLSFHDHPPLVFLIQYLFFLIFGVSTFIARLPFVIAGVLSVYLLFLIATKLFNERIGLLAALILTISNYHIWISRTGYLESILIFFIVLSFYYFLKLIEDNSRKNYFLFGLFLGLAFLCKYSMLFLLPVYFFYLLFFKNRTLKNKKVLLSIIVFLLIISPVIFYNLMVLKTRGHLDLQFSQILGLDISQDWSLFTKGAGEKDLWQNFKGVFGTLYSALGQYVFYLFIISSIFLLIKSLLVSFMGKVEVFLLIYVVFFLILQFTLTGSSIRFLPVFIPFVALIIAFVIYYVYKNLPQKVLKNILLIILILFSFYAVIEDINTHRAKALTHPYNPSLRLENYGFRQLESYLQEQNIDFRDSVVIFDGRLNWFCRTWYFFRWVNYWNYNYVSIEYFIEGINMKGEDYFKKEKGYNNYYFIKAENTILEPGIKSNAAEIFEEFLAVENGVEPELIYRDDGQVAFKVYYFN